jgi:hypothetical protein
MVRAARAGLGGVLVTRLAAVLLLLAGAGCGMEGEYDKSLRRAGYRAGYQAAVDSVRIADAEVQAIKMLWHMGVSFEVRAYPDSAPNVLVIHRNWR